MMKNWNSLGKIAVALGIATVSLLSTTQSASALLINKFEFIDEDGYSDFGDRIPGGKVTGEITFNNLNPGDSANDVAADSLVITSIPDWISSSWNDSAGFQVGQNLLSNSFNVNDNVFQVSNGLIQSAGSFVRSAYEELTTTDSGVFASEQEEIILYPDFAQLRDSFVELPSGFTREVVDNDASSLVFTQASSAAVPFEFSPSLGLLIVGSLWGVSYHVKGRAARKEIDKV